MGCRRRLYVSNLVVASLPLSTRLSDYQYSGVPRQHKCNAPGKQQTVLKFQINMSFRHTVLFHYGQNQEE